MMNAINPLPALVAFYFLAMMVLTLLLMLFFSSCTEKANEDKQWKIKKELVEAFFQNQEEFLAGSFDFPVNPPEAKDYYSALNFGSNLHLGEDWNNRLLNDFGDPVYAIANGVVVFAGKYSKSWGNVIRIVHLLPDGEMVESLYAHCHEIFVSRGAKVNKNQKIASIGSAGGVYTPHLHFEIRKNIYLPVGAGYGVPDGYLAPTPFILGHRKVEKSYDFSSSYNRIYSANTNESMLLQAVKSNNIRLVNDLIRRKVNVNARDLEGETPLMYATVAGQVRILKSLLKAGANRSLRDKYGYTAYMRARFHSKQYPGIVKLLQREKP
ncbi:MAG: peptidoglycan DD-metalloendopeptidase family protein [Spirochaetota bacterium]